MATERDYDKGMTWVFEEALSEKREVPEHLVTGYESYPFTKDDLDRHLGDAGIPIKNIPDILYSYRVGRTAMPPAVSSRGHWVIDGAGKGKYLFVKVAKPPFFDIPDDVEATVVEDKTPRLVLQGGATDEQSMLTRIRYNDLVAHFLGLPEAHHVQGHVRKFIKHRGQIEVDDLYVGRDEQRDEYVIPVEAKNEAENERLGAFQILSLIRYAQQVYPTAEAIPLGVKINADASVTLVRFNVTTSYDDIEAVSFRKYVFDGAGLASPAQQHGLFS